MSLRSSLWRYLGLLAVAALAVGVLAGPASAKKMSAKQRAAVRTQLKKEIKKNPKAINRKSFVKRASLVNFKLPVTIALRGGSTAANPNKATVDLGASLGQREVDLGGSLSAELTFHDSYDGGALGNVDLSILPSANHSLTSTSIPLLWNTQVSDPATRYDANSLGLPTALSGCGNFVGSSALSFGGALAASGVVGGIPQPGGLPGYPFVDPSVSLTTPAGFLPVTPGVDSIDAVTAGKAAGDNNQVGGNPQPFPYSAQSTPGGFTQPPSPKDTVLRTNALNLGIAPAGTEVKQDNNANGVTGSQNIVVGKSGGQANLFGNIPGKAYGIDVTVSLKTRINSILRVVDQDSFGTPLITGNNYPAGIFNCRQIWTGGIDNYIPSVRLAGNLKIAPGITAGGKLRIAKATVSSLPGSEARFAVAACLAPYAGYDKEQLSSDTVAPTIPAGSAATGPGGTVPNAGLPADTSAARTPMPAANCNDAPTSLVASSALAPSSVSSLAPAVPADGYTTTSSGSSVSVGADLNVSNISLDILVGDVN
ncbi:hypothetical protein DSM104299_04279 [Baekduia alba]|nr:hypothetical protein DSM104299_04279 [Baekduia alba]